MARWMTGTILAVFAGGMSLGACGGSAEEASDGGGSGASLVDENGDGIPDGIDRDGDGEADVTGEAIDEDGDGQYDGLDTNGDGEIDEEFPDGSSGGGSGSGSGTISTSDGTQIIQVTVIPGGGDNSAPLQPGCGPETAGECIAPGGGCNSDALVNDGAVQVQDAGAVCFYGAVTEDPEATVEYIHETVSGEEYVHFRVTFSPNFVDTIYGECSHDCGWSPRRGHTFRDLVSSDHTELFLNNCDGETSMHILVDFIEEDTSAPCGYASAGVTGGDGGVVVGDPEHVLAATTSLDRNLNGCGYCETEQSACPADASEESGICTESSVDSPEWDFRMVYDVWVAAEAFGPSGFCEPVIESVHASPAKTESETIEVEPDDCPPPPDGGGGGGDGGDGDGDGDGDGGGGGGGGSCPPNYELYLSSEGEYLCAGPPNDGQCETGYELDLTSEGELCIPEGQQ